MINNNDALARSAEAVCSAISRRRRYGDHPDGRFLQQGEFFADAVVDLRSMLSVIDKSLEDMLRDFDPLNAAELRDFVISAQPTSPIAPAALTVAQNDRTSYPREGVERIWLYILGCSGCMRLSNEYGHPVYKIGITNDCDFDKRLNELQGDSYAGTVRIGETIVTQAGFERWVTLAIATSGHSYDERIEILPRAIAIDLPRWMTARAFDAALRKALEARAVHRRSYPGKPDRLTAYVTGGNKEQRRVNRATELYEIAPRDKREGDMLLRTIESILCVNRQIYK